MTPTRTQITQLRKALPHGAIRKIHERLKEKKLNFSYDVVAHVIRGEYYKSEIIDEAFVFLADYRKQESIKAKKFSTQLERIAS